MCNAFFENGNDVTLIAPYRKNNKKIDGVNIYDFYGVKKNIKIHFLYYPNVVGGAFIYSLILLLYLIKFRPDLVYGRFLLGCALSTFLGLKVMYESHNESWKETFYSIYLLKYLNRKKNFSKIIVISNALKKAFLRLRIFNDKRILVLHDGANKIHLSNNVNIILIGKKHGINICYVGHLYPGKGMEIISKIAPLLSEFNFHIIGGFNEDITFWKSKINSDNILFYGHIPHLLVQKYISLIDICLLPLQKTIRTFGYKNKETLNIANYTSPLKLFEYMAANKLVIASNLPVIKEILNDKNSILVDSNDTVGWANAIKQASDSTLRNKLALNAHKLFLNNYTWERRVEKILNEC